MKTIGLIGGMSWESAILPYYRQITETVQQALGGLHSAKIVLGSVDFHGIEILQHTDNWQPAGNLLAQAASTLETAGAEDLVLCANTMYKVAPAIEELRQGRIHDASRRRCLDAIAHLIAHLTAQGAQAIIPGCTEIGLLLQQHHVDVPLFGTTGLHARHAAAWALQS